MLCNVLMLYREITLLPFLRVKYLTYLPDSKAGDAIGESSTLRNSWPSVGLFGFG